MNALKRHLVFALWIAGCVMLVGAGLVWTVRLRKSARSEQAAVEMKTRQREQWLHEIRSLDSPGGRPAEADVAAASPEAEALPAKSLDSFIAIAGAVEQMRHAAESRKVGLRADESFGFTSYAHQGPAEKDLPAVHQQLALTRLLVEKLVAAHPDRLYAVRREHLRAGRSDVPGEIAADFFQPDGRLDLRVAGQIEGRAIRLEFAGSTAVLRDFLQAVASAPEPLVVRSVEVESGPAAMQGQANTSRICVDVMEVRPAGVRANRSNEGGPLVSLPGWERAVIAGPVGRTLGYALFDHPTPRSAAGATAEGSSATGGNKENLAVELLAVKREPYRLQLSGYYGVPGDCTVAFVRPGFPEILLVRKGHRFESLGVVFRDFAVKKTVTQNAAGEAGVELTASALLWDERQQAEVTLVGSKPLLTDTPVALLRCGAPAARAREFRVGDWLGEGALQCRIEHIGLDPAEVVLVREISGQPVFEKLLLKPGAPVPATFSSADLRP